MKNNNKNQSLIDYYLEDITQAENRISLLLTIDGASREPHPSINREIKYLTDRIKTVNNLIKEYKKDMEQLKNKL